MYEVSLFCHLSQKTVTFHFTSKNFQEIKPVAKTPGVQKIISKTEGPLRKTETKLSGVKKVTSIKEVETTTDEDDLIMM